jgi:hypothetical protein
MDTGLVDAAVVERLANDGVLATLCPDGVYWGIRPGGSPAPGAFVIVALFDHREQPGLDSDTLYERTNYLVKAVVYGTSKTPARLAAARIHELLHGTLLDLSAAGYTAMDFRRLDRVAYPEIDLVNKATWHHHGGQYELMSYPTTSPWETGTGATFDGRVFDVT